MTLLKNDHRIGTFRVALANIQFPPTPEDSITQAETAIAEASRGRADLILVSRLLRAGNGEARAARRFGVSRSSVMPGQRPDTGRAQQPGRIEQVVIGLLLLLL